MRIIRRCQHVGSVRQQRKQALDKLKWAVLYTGGLSRLDFVRRITGMKVSEVIQVDMANSNNKGIVQHVRARFRVNKTVQS